MRTSVRTKNRASRLATTGAALLGLALATPALTLTEPTSAPAVQDGKGGVFVLGIDGMDPVVLQRMIDEGRMPNFKKLAADGSFQELGTSNPPQSPVAWSNFVTGMNPGGHGIYDFIHRDPKNYNPIVSALPAPSGEEPTMLNLFGYTLPLYGGDEMVNNRSGTPFWDYLHAAGVKTEVYRMPGNYPPTPSDALTLSGMGTDDLRASNGMYSWYTTDPDDIFNAPNMKVNPIQVDREDLDGDGYAETIETQLYGPADSMKINPTPPEVRIPMKIWLDNENQTAWIEVGGRSVIVEAGGWSDWVQVDFDMVGGGLMNLSGIVRFYVKAMDSDFRLYVSPINFAPALPVAPITTPTDDVLVELHEELGNFYTQGMPEETNAFKDGTFDDDDFVKQVMLVHEDGHKMLDLALDRFDRGDMSFMYLSDIDLQCHMLWHHADPKDASRSAAHPAHKPELAERHGSHVEDFYEGVDAVLGETRARLPADTLLIVMSDHGFQPYTRKIELNAWLRDEGYLAMKFPEVEEGEEPEEDPERSVTGTHSRIDWGVTQAFGLGFNGIYLNLQGREGQGIVPAAEARALADEIIAKLNALTDPATGKKAVIRAYHSSDIYSGPRVDEAPDIVVGYAAGFGCANESVEGHVELEVFHDNTGHDFTGNHLMDPSQVPGILLTSQPLLRDGHDLTDITATLLDYYDVPKPADMVGASVLD